MKQLFLENSMNFICKYQSISDYDKKKVKYGLEGLYLTITKMVLLTILALLLNMFKEFILVVVFFNVIRYTGFGFHAEKSYQCLLFSTFNFIAIPFLLLHIQLSNFFVYTICAICIFHYLLFAPADTKKRPLSNKRKRIIRKIITVMIGFIYTLMIILLNNTYWTSIILSAMIIQAIIISPLIYRLFNQPYNNYKALNI
ncbi:MAG TPA: accessory gene regulator B family protein [Candidatus Faecimonas intestinavium]|jgi:accessory gene regulator B|nr:accessory gene regulator B family protein [Candidatus Faecimonas intestinavium]